MIDRLFQAAVPGMTPRPQRKAVMRTLRILLVLVALLSLASGASRATPTTSWVGDTLNAQLQNPAPLVVFNGNFTVPTTGIDLTVLPFTLDLLSDSVTLHV